MPNWTTSAWSIEGNTEAINTVRKALKDDLFDFNQLIPTPKELEQTRSLVEILTSQEEVDTVNAAAQKLATENGWENPAPIAAITAEERSRRMEKYGAADWYSFRLLRWGTKWVGRTLEILCDEPERLVLRFDTAWSAPVPIAKHLQSLGLRVYGGGIYEDGSEFELLGDDQATFDERFLVTETTETGDDYSWTSRSIDWIGKAVPVEA